MSTILYPTLKIGLRFRRLLLCDLGPDKFDEMVMYNILRSFRTQSYCKSQDYTEPYRLMDQAFEEIIGRPPDYNNDQDVEVIDEAWVRARLDKYLTVKKKT